MIHLGNLIMFLLVIVCRGASMGGTNEGISAEFTFSKMKSSPYYESNADVIKFIAGGQAGWSGQTSIIEANLKWDEYKRQILFKICRSNDFLGLAPYYGSLSDAYDTPQDKYGPLWAFPVQERTV